MTKDEAIKFWQHVKPGQYGFFITYKQLLPVSKRHGQHLDPTKCYRITTRHCRGTVPYTHNKTIKDLIAQGFQVQENRMWEPSTIEGEIGIIYYNKYNGEPGLKFTPTHELDKNVYYIMGNQVSRQDIEQMVQNGELLKGALKDRAPEEEVEFFPYITTLINMEIRNKTSGNFVADDKAIKHSNEYTEGLNEAMAKYDKFPAMTADGTDVVYNNSFEEELEDYRLEDFNEEENNISDNYIEKYIDLTEPSAEYDLKKYLSNGWKIKHKGTTLIILYKDDVNNDFNTNLNNRKQTAMESYFSKLTENCDEDIDEYDIDASTQKELEKWGYGKSDFKEAYNYEDENDNLGDWGEVDIQDVISNEYQPSLYDDVDSDGSIRANKIPVNKLKGFEDVKDYYYFYNRRGDIVVERIYRDSINPIFIFQSKSNPTYSFRNREESNKKYTSITIKDFNKLAQKYIDNNK